MCISVVPGHYQGISFWDKLIIVWSPLVSKGGHCQLISIHMCYIAVEISVLVFCLAVPDYFSMNMAAVSISSAEERTVYIDCSSACLKSVWMDLNVRRNGAQFSEHIAVL